MHKVSKQHQLAINQLMLPLIGSVANTGCTVLDADIGYYKMLLADALHNAAALDVFNTTLDAAQLHNSIMYQDTSPREHFYTVLKYIEDNGLIPAKQYACK